MRIFADETNTIEEQCKWNGEELLRGSAVQMSGD